MPPRMESRYSTTVTLAPSRAQTEPSSRPITPPPTTIIVAGTLASSRAPVEVTIAFSSNSTLTPGMPATSEPVAMTMLAVGTSSILPSASVTATTPGAMMRPVPRSTSILFFFMRKSRPLVFWETDCSLWAIICFRFSLGVPTSTPRAAKEWPASAKISEAWSKALDGMQPTLTQVPPCVGRFSTTAVRRPSSAALMAQT